jgi:ribonuclease HI
MRVRSLLENGSHITVFVRWVPCHHGMARPQVADVKWVPCHQGMARSQVADVRWVPCHQGMARPQVADVRWVPCHQGRARPQVADVRWVPCLHSMARPQVADGGDTFQVWRVAVNILNKQSWTTDKVWSSSLVGRGANNSSP